MIVAIQPAYDVYAGWSLVAWSFVLCNNKEVFRARGCTFLCAIHQIFYSWWFWLLN